MTRSWLIVVCMLMLILSSDLGFAGRTVEIALEAELANEIVDPMVIAVPGDVKGEGGPAPDEPSNGEFIWVPGKPLEGGPNGNKGYAQFIIDIPEDDTYAIWAWVVAWDGNSDSFWVVWEPADKFENPQQTDNKDFRWSVRQGPAWHWDRIEAWKEDGTHVDREWDVPAGPTTLTIFCREDATMLDTLFITNNTSSSEADVKPRLPTDEDRKNQILGIAGQAVDAKGKLATTWAELRQ